MSQFVPSRSLRKGASHAARTGAEDGGSSSAAGRSSGLPPPGPSVLAHSRRASSTLRGPLGGLASPPGYESDALDQSSSATPAAAGAKPGSFAAFQSPLAPSLGSRQRPTLRGGSNLAGASLSAAGEASFSRSLAPAEYSRASALDTSVSSTLSLRRERNGEELLALPPPVTVFGFPPESASAIVHRFQSYGEILRRHPGGSNFVHILYKLPVHAQIALNQNGKVFDGVMIGVVPTPSHMWPDWRTDASGDGGSRIGASGYGASDSRVLQSAAGMDDSTTSARRGFRSRLGAGGPGRARSSAELQRDVEARPRGRGRSACSKIMEFLFNW